MSAATWLVPEIDQGDDTLFNPAGLGFGFSTLNGLSLGELQSLRFPFGLSIELDRSFWTNLGLSD